ncbi:hypothetical protein P7C70_g4096, partial [Phenoliferia sp. Uapishka_3]
MTAPTPLEYSQKLASAECSPNSPFHLAQAAGRLAHRQEHFGAYSLAFTSYITAAQSYLFLIRHTHDPIQKAKLREVSKAFVERAEKIKKAGKGAVGGVARDRLSVGGSSFQTVSIGTSSLYLRAVTNPSSLLALSQAGYQSTFDYEGASLSRFASSRSPRIDSDLRAFSPAYVSEKSWSRLSTAFHQGLCVVTIGTAKDDATAISTNGLVEGHNYAISDFDVRERTIEIINPWRPQTPKDDVRSSGDCVGDLRAALLKKHSTIFRLKMDPAPTTAAEICLLLSRHQRTSQDAREFLGLDVGATNVTESVTGAQAELDSGLIGYLPSQTSFIDSPHFFYRFSPEPQQAMYDIHISHRGPTPELGITLQALGSTPLKIIDGPEPLPHSYKISGKWSDRSAGGNHTCASFSNNPQFRIDLIPVSGKPNMNGKISVAGRASQDSTINVKLVRARGERVYDFEERDVLSGSSKYSYGRDSLHCEALRTTDSYTLVVSSFRAGDEGFFDLDIKSDLQLRISPIPQEGAGMYSRVLKGSWSPGFDGGSQEVLRNPIFLVGGSGTAKPFNIKLALL